MCILSEDVAENSEVVVTLTSHDANMVGLFDETAELSVTINTRSLKAIPGTLFVALFNHTHTQS